MEKYNDIYYITRNVLIYCMLGVFVQNYTTITPLKR